MPAFGTAKPGTMLITGAARRIGAAMARDLAAAGWAVAVHHNAHGADAERLAADIEATGGRAVTLKADLMDDAATEALIARAADALGPVTCLVNNASIFEMDEPETATRQSWDAHMAVNLRAPFVLCQAFKAALGDREGNIVNIVDERVVNPGIHFTSYTLSKMALWDLTRVLARAWAPRVRVNAIGPGPTLANDRQNADQFARQASSTPLGRPVDPADICRALRFILDAPSFTGQMIAMDSGQHMGLADDSLDLPE